MMINVVQSLSNIFDSLLLLLLSTIEGQDMAAAKKIAMEISRDRKMPYVNGYDHPLIMSGQGTIGLEIVEQCEDADAIVVPVGGGGLIAGIATAVKTMSPRTKIIVRGNLSNPVMGMIVTVSRASSLTSALHFRRQWRTAVQFIARSKPEE